MKSKKTITDSGVIIYKSIGLNHRNHDKPAIIHPNGDKEWWMYDKLHIKKVTDILRGRRSPFDRFRR